MFLVILLGNFYLVKALQQICCIYNISLTSTWHIIQRHLLLSRDLDHLRPHFGGFRFPLFWMGNNKQKARYTQAYAIFKFGSIWIN